ncbi:hypothetical protein IMAU10118_03157 [Lactiplantibacillus plantarum]|nr:hypothetical protein [Lactiplantibacillus plantarum]MCG0644361.1 hypothetical protein [Lactiplantibacillus plantarum]MCG0801869.1 hypothetical protein [Lactiplantibacillus plantarum]MCG0832909.1 hypothetical protein [Lactiplantibacillus plantarum]MCG0857529.1 hypothetical protein [Lactiplantibacillus plantarum]
MLERNLTVIGSYSTREEALAVMISLFTPTKMQLQILVLLDCQESMLKPA